MPRHVVMLGQPEALVAERLDVTRERHRIDEGIRNRAALADRREVENGKRRIGECRHGRASAICGWPHHVGAKQGDRRGRTGRADTIPE